MDHMTGGHGGILSVGVVVGDGGWGLVFSVTLRKSSHIDTYHLYFQCLPYSRISV